MVLLTCLNYLTCGILCKPKKKKPKYGKRKVKKKGCCGGLCCTMTMEDIRKLNPAYKRADEYAQVSKAGARGTKRQNEIR